MPGLLRRLLPPALSALLATAIAVPVTWQLAERSAADPADASPPVVAGPANLDQLRTQLLAALPEPDAAGAVLLEPPLTGAAAAGLAPGRYRLQLICGQLRVQTTVAAIRIWLRTPSQRWTIELPCPSTVLAPEQELDFTEQPAGAVSTGLASADAPPVGILVLVRLLPVTGAGGTDG